MKVEIEVLVTRVNGEIFYVDQISDHYSEISIKIPYDVLDIDAKNKLESHYWVFRDNGYYNNQEAKDLCINAGNLKISFETVSVEIV